MAAAKSLQSCLTLCDPMDGSPPGSPVPGILQARTLEWVAISFSNAWKGKVKVKSLSRVRLFATPWTAAHQAPPSIDFPGKSTGVGCHCLLHKYILAVSFFVDFFWRLESSLLILVVWERFCFLIMYCDFCPLFYWYGILHCLVFGCLNQSCIPRIHLTWLWHRILLYINMYMLA